MIEHHLDLSPLRNAVASLDAALAIVGDRTWFDAQSTALRDTVTAGVIQNFEFVYELSVKMLRRRMELDADHRSDVDALSFRDLIRSAAEKALVTEVEPWFHFRSLRNISAHTYDRTKAQHILGEILSFREYAKSMLSRLEARNG